jgi:LysM repeat protein
MKSHGGGPLVTTLAADRAVSPTRGFLLKPEAVNATPQKRAVQTYTVVEGDTLSGIASQFGVTVDTLRWANNMKDIDTLKLDQKVLIPPVNGVLVTVHDGDSIDSLAAKYNVTAAAIVEFNLVRDPSKLTPGSQVMIPDGVGEPLPAPPPGASSSGGSSGSSTVFGISRFTGGSSGHFPWGYCTWYVATKRYVPWNGDAHSWFGNAQAYGFPTGRTPRPGAIMVTWESWWGHVAYVESVSGSCWNVSEMNYAGFGIVSYRHICPGQVPLIGFVY